MRYLLAENLAILLCASAGFVFGAVRYLKPRRPLYASMIVLGLGCMMLGRLYQCVLLWTGSGLMEQFQIGILGTAGAFSFFLSANYGQIDSLVDDGGPDFLRFRAIAWAAPVLVAALYVPVAASQADFSVKIGCGIAAVLIAAAGYFHLKHLMIPDVDYGVVRCQRGFNALGLCMGLCNMLELIALCHGLVWLFIACGGLLCAVCLAIVPLMDRGVRKWTA